MADTTKTIRDWLHSQQDWLQYATEILLSDRSVPDERIDELIAYLKTPEGQRVTEHREFEGLAANASDASALRLTEIGDIRGIENLSPRHPLSFGEGNLCVIYGHNGSGKSGYTHILNKICGKPRSRDLKPNVFDAAPAERLCKIGYSINGEAREVEWIANSAPIDDLRSVDIFDTEAATAYLTEEKAATYTPPAVALFEELASVCTRIRESLKAQQDGLVSSLPQLPADYATTPAGATYRRLRADLPEAEIQSLIQWGPEDEKTLEQLGERLKAEDPARLARFKRSIKQQLDQLASSLKAAATAFGADGIEKNRSLRTDADNKRRIANEAAKVDSAELEGVETETWRALWEAARAYSQTAYPGRPFPVTDDARCVLCHQPLDERAQQRLQDFEGFVQGKLESEAKAADKAYRRALDALPAALTEEQVTTILQAAGLSESPLAKQMTEVCRQVGRVRAALLGHEAENPTSPMSWPKELLDELSNRTQALEREASQYEEDAKHFDREHVLKEKLQLEARKWTAQQADAIRAEINRRRCLEEYEQWKRLTNSQGISRKAGDIAEEVVTQAFVDRFNQELKALGASRVKVELCKTRTDRARALHKLLLKGARTDQALPESVLSEGERRIVGLAALLADVAEQPQAAPFVFDDPISSLDHDYEWYVAVRLAQLARTRQVLVFTHRLSLYGAMEDAARKIGDDWKRENFHQHCIESFSGTAGHPADQAVWNANTKKANNILLSRLGDARKAGEASGAEAYRALAQGICSDFRKLLERTVEDDLLNQVVRRHRRSVTTDNRLAPLPLIDQEDCKFIDELMTKYSCYEHSQSEETPVFIPDEPELRQDIQSLKDWRERFKTRTHEETIS
ncbi:MULTISPECIES: AAA family ATPase [unclassified Salinivibrio]|uniref:AAA family ATPase n=1 Tax=unclassified Salinivibrio TaxID=2636825 RepID=UPI00128C8DA7|nr:MULTISPECIES: AAA family ATPase [unclassified Salinivibrio]MPS32630.1 restriction endonuclease [Salinivibrio sp. VYel7]MPX94021.1 restriction endonuclease [Salinivibrio sp. VYel9]MPY00119.1 restriction endonuclease [Salinivibrio sp. VYel4]MPY03187.1 restriction endonuclease [Salinivibrio sp. VYel5]